MPLANFNNATGIDEYEEFAQSARRIQMLGLRPANPAKGFATTTDGPPAPREMA